MNRGHDSFKSCGLKTVFWLRIIFLARKGVNLRLAAQQSGRQSKRRTGRRHRVAVLSGAEENGRWTLHDQSLNQSGAYLNRLLKKSFHGLFQLASPRRMSAARCKNQTPACLIFDAARPCGANSLLKIRFQQAVKPGRGGVFQADPFPPGSSAGTTTPSGRTAHTRGKSGTAPAGGPETATQTPAAASGWS